MGIRSTQYLGLPAEALEYINTFAVKRRRIILEEGVDGIMRVIQDQVISIPPQSDTWSSTYGMYEEEIPLVHYVLNGVDWYEEVQFADWSSGPVIATKLVTKEGRGFLWSDEDYQKYL